MEHYVKKILKSHPGEVQILMLSLLLKILKVLNLGAFMSAKCDLIPHQTVNTVKYFTQILGQLFRRGKVLQTFKA